MAVYSEGATVGPLVRGNNINNRRNVNGNNGPSSRFGMTLCVPWGILMRTYRNLFGILCSFAGWNGYAKMGNTCKLRIKLRNAVIEMLYG